MADIKAKAEAKQKEQVAPAAAATHVQVTVKVPAAKAMVVTVPLGASVHDVLKAAGVTERPGYEIYIDNKLASSGSVLMKDVVVAYVPQVVGG